MTLSLNWLACLEEAWAAYRHGSVPVGAVWVDESEEIRFRGRNRINEATAPHPLISNTRLAHAEMNVLVQVAPDQFADMGSGTLYTSLEPCPLCIGALTMSGVRQLRFGARDGRAGATALLTSFPYMHQKNIVARGPNSEVQTISLVLMTAHLTKMRTARTEDFLQAFEKDDLKAVALGRMWGQSGYLNQAAQRHWSIQDLIDAISESI